MLSAPFDQLHVLNESAWSSSVPWLVVGADPSRPLIWSEVRSEQAGTGIDSCRVGLLRDVLADTLGCTAPLPQPARSTAAAVSADTSRGVGARTGSDNTSTPSPVQWCVDAGS